MNVHVDHASRVADLEAFAGVGAQSNGAVTVASPSIAVANQDRVFGAQQVAVHRDETKVLQKLAALGAAAGDHWFYRYPVKNRKKGTTEYIEGPTIKLANDLARIYGNCEVDTRVYDLGTSWLIYARFVDYETGYATTRPFQQQKGGSRMGGDDDARRLDIAFQIGVSKAVRNVTVNALQTFADYAFDAARNSLVEKIGKNLVGYRDRTVQGIENLGVELIRVELVVGKPAKDWTAPDVARVIALMKGIADGMSTIDETFPPKEEAKVDGQTGEVLSNFASTTTEGAAATDDVRVNENFGQTESASKEYQDRVTGAAGTKDTPAADKQQAQGSQPAESGPHATAGATEGAEKGDGGTVPNNASAPSATNGSKDPSNDAEYDAYATKWIAEQTDPEEPRARWAREKGMRNKANVLPETRDRLEAAVKAKVAELKKKS